jgi:hypothetical protein
MPQMSLKRTPPFRDSHVGGIRFSQRRHDVTGEIDLAAVQGRGIGERARAEPADIIHWWMSRLVEEQSAKHGFSRTATSEP